VSQLARYDALCRAIDAAYRVDELKGIRDQAKLLEAASRLAHNTENERRACEIRLRAERKAGQLSAKLDRSNPGKRKKDLGSVVEPKSKALRDAGITKKQAHEWEKLAAVSDKEFEAALADRTAMPTTNGIIRANAVPTRNPVSTEALWLWGRLLDFDREGLLAQEPSDVLATMTPEMLDDTHSYAPRVARWLTKIGKM
jgi:hypothetical protein